MTIAIFDTNTVLLQILVKTREDGDEISPPLVQCKRFDHFRAG